MIKVESNLKNRGFNTLLALAIVVGTLVPSNIVTYITAVTQTQKAVDAKWRQATKPIFAARRMPGLWETATPISLSHALDATYVMTFSERYKFSPEWRGYDRGTKIIIAPEHEEWILSGY